MELRKLAEAWMAKELPGQTLQAAALAYDACLRLVDFVRFHGTITDQIVSTRHATGVWD